MLSRSDKLLVSVTAGLVLLGAWIVTTQRPRLRTPMTRAEVRLGSLVDRLDALVQKRFASVEGAFGANRLAMGPHDFWSIAPDAECQALAAEFERAGVRAYFRTLSLKRGEYTWGTPVKPMYTAKTRLNVEVRFPDREHLEVGLKNSPGTYRDVREVVEGEYHQSLSWPVQIVTQEHMTEAAGPEFPALREGIEQSISALRTAPSHTFRSGAWEVVARPIRASSTKCFSCHADPKGHPARLHETLGLALYVMRRAAAGPQGVQQAQVGGSRL